MQDPNRPLDPNRPYPEPTDPYQASTGPYQDPSRPYQNPSDPRQASPGQYQDRPYQESTPPRQTSPGPYQEPTAPRQAPPGPYQEPARPYQEPGGQSYQTPVRPYQDPNTPYQASPGSYQEASRPHQEPTRANQQTPMVSPPKIESVRRLINKRVVNPVGEELGIIEELVIDLEAGRIAYAVLSFSNFLGLSSKLFAIPWPALRFSTHDKTFILNVEKEVLKQAPGFDKNNWPDMADPRWNADIHGYYGHQPY